MLTHVSTKMLAALEKAMDTFKDDVLSEELSVYDDGKLTQRMAMAAALVIDQTAGIEAYFRREQMLSTEDS